MRSGPDTFSCVLVNRRRPPEWGAIRAWPVAIALLAIAALCSESVAAPSTRSGVATTALEAGCATEGPGLMSPPDGATLPSPVLFSWEPVPGAGFYQAITLFRGEVVEQPPLAATSMQIELPAGEYEWFVRVYSPGCPEVESRRRSFRILEGAACDTIQTPMLLEPPPGATNVPPLVRLAWSTVPEAADYEVMVMPEGESPKSFVTRDTQFSLALRAGLVRWRVFALIPGCDAKPSDEWQFSVESTTTCGGSPVSLEAPPRGGTSQSSVTFRWGALPGAVGYRVRVSVNGGAFSGLGDLVTTSSLTAQLPAGLIEWAVESVFPGDCPPLVSEVWFFNVEKGASCTGDRPSIVAPPNGAVDVPSPAQFSWSAVAGALVYHVIASINGEPPAEIGISETTTMTRELPRAKIEWWVIAEGPGCDPTESEHARFSTATAMGCEGLEPSLTMPASGATVSSKVDFAWMRSGDDVLYRVWLAGEEGEPFVLGETPETGLSRRLEPGSYVWRVEALKRDCPPAISPEASFKVAGASNCPTETPSLVSPGAGQAGVVSPVTFIWTSVTGAAGYALWIANAEGFERPVDLTRATTLEVYLPPGRWNWFIEIFFEGCAPLRSARSSFEISGDGSCARMPPFLMHPPIGDAVVLTSPVFFEWTPVTGAKQYEIWVGYKDGEPTRLGTASETHFQSELPVGVIAWQVRAVVEGCGTIPSAVGIFKVVKEGTACTAPERPEIRAVAQARSEIAYDVAWPPVPGAGLYEIEESPDERFDDTVASNVSASSASFKHTVAQPRAWYYRVRATSSCDKSASLYSNVLRVVVVPDTTSGPVRVDQVDIYGSTAPIVQKLVLPGGAASTTFTATPTKSWITVSPSSGTLPPEGATLTLTSDPKQLPPGASSANILITMGGARAQVGAGSAEGGGTSSVPVSVTLAAPMNPTTKSEPTQNSLIIPAVGHAAGSNSQWQSDIRIANVTSQSMNYVLYFTTSATDGTGTIRQATVTIAPGQTIAFSDILATWYGLGATGESATGTLEIRPQTASLGTSSSAASLATAMTTVASSRTYNVSSTGTFGQFIPAVPYTQFVGKGKILSLQQVAQSNDYRTNVGVVEGSGEAATVQFEVFDGDGTDLLKWNEAMLPGEHRQFDRILATKGIALDDGRIELSVLSDTGKITAYASRVDNLTNDPELIVPVVAADTSDTTWVVPGVGDVDNSLASWRTDLRIYNAGDATVTAALTFFPQGNPTASISRQATIAAGEVVEMNDLLESTFGTTNTLGSLHITTPEKSKLVPTARTYNKTTNGTYGQFIPAVCSSQGARSGGRPLQILQVEQSPQYRTNLGLFEMSGAAVTVEVAAILPDALAAPRKTYALQPNEFRQINMVMGDFGITEAYNARLTVKVLSGAGLVGAYASVVDMATQDPTYVPAQ